MSAFDRLLDLLDQNGCRPRRTRRGATARCPAHEDRTPSLSLRARADGAPLIRCHAGCSNDAVLAALRTSWRELLSENGSTPPLARPRPRIAARYRYEDEAGRLLFEKVRLEPKSFRLRRPRSGAEGGWSWNMEGVRRVLYRLPQVREAVDAGEAVWICEGEKDADALAQAGVCATCNPGGAGKWDVAYAEMLRGCHGVIVVADRDEPGRRHAAEVAAAVRGVVDEVYIVEAAQGKDASDHLAAGLGVGDFVQVLGSSPGSSPVRPRLSSSLRPLPYRGDEGGQSVPEFVPGSSPTHSWLPVDIVTRAADPPAPADVISLFYVGYNHLISGESEALKTWLALAASASELVAGRGVLWVDGDDVGQGAILERLRLLGAPDDAIASRFAYVTPDEPLDAELRSDVMEVVRVRSCRLAVLDGFNPLLNLHGLDPDRGADVERFYRLFDPVRKAPTAVLLTDNVVKAREARGKWAIGSERKKSKAEVHLGMVALVPLVRDGTGRARIDVHKDRRGHLTRPSPGLFEVISAGGTCAWRVRADDSHGEDGGFRPTALMERVSRHLERHSEPQTRNQVERNVTGKGASVRIAIDRLIAEGYATEFDGMNRSRLVRLERVFRADEEDER